MAAKPRRQYDKIDIGALGDKGKIGANTFAIVNSFHENMLDSRLPRSIYATF